MKQILRIMKKAGGTRSTDCSCEDWQGRDFVTASGKVLRLCKDQEDSPLDVFFFDNPHSYCLEWSAKFDHSVPEAFIVAFLKEVVFAQS